MPVRVARRGGGSGGSSAVRLGYSFDLGRAVAELMGDLGYRVERVAEGRSGRWWVAYFVVDSGWSWRQFHRFINTQMDDLRRALAQRYGRPVFVRAYKKLVTDALGGEIVKYHLKVGILVED